MLPVLLGVHRGVLQGFTITFCEKNSFFQDQLENLSIVSAIFGHKFQNDLHRGQPLAVLPPNESIWHVCRVFRFLGYLVQK